MAKRKIAVSSDVYTAVLALAFLAVLATAAFTAYQCGTQYGWESLFRVVTTVK
jgi:hypothetical protein